MILASLKSVKIPYAFRFEFKANNNYAKYKALIIGLKLALTVNVDKEKIWIDS